MSRRSPRREDPLTYRIAYSRIAQELHAWSENGRERGGPERQGIPARVGDAVVAVLREVPAPRRTASSDREPWLDREMEERPAELARELVDASREELLRLGHRWVGQRRSRFERLKSRRWSAADSRLDAFLACVVEPATVAMYFSVRVEEGWTANFAPPSKEENPVDRRLDAKRNEAPDAWLRSYLERIRRADAEISYRARYNLACLFSRSAWQGRREERPPELHLAEAARQLELCLTEVSGQRRAAIQAWAWRDPALAGVKELDWQRFLRIVGPPPEVG